MRCKLLIVGCRNWQFRLISEYFHSLWSLGISVMSGNEQMLPDLPGLFREATGL